MVWQFVSSLKVWFKLLCSKTDGGEMIYKYSTCKIMAPSKLTLHKNQVAIKFTNALTQHLDRNAWRHGLEEYKFYSQENKTDWSTGSSKTYPLNVKCHAQTEILTQKFF